MKRRILLFAAILFGITTNAQVTAASVTMGPGYANQVYYKLSNQATNAYPHASWDIAFLRTSSFGFAARTNEARGIETYEASANIADWATIDVANIANWTRLYNSETEWDLGAVDQGSAAYGWGTYNVATHHVSGAVVFVLKYTDGTFRKFRIDDFFGGYTFTYATWSGSAWLADTTVTLSNTANPTMRYNYYSLESNAAVLAEPSITDWDLVFTKYNTDLMGDGSVMYNVTGVLHHPDLEVAENLESGGNANLTYSADINTIGYDWKTFTGTAYTVNTDKAFYVKYPGGTIYRVIFSTFAGSGTGVITFNHEDVTALLATDNFANNVSFGVYPNPTLDKKINVIYEMPNGNADRNTVSVFNLTGAKVYEKQINNASGFFNQEIDLGNLNTGVYILKFESGNYSTTKKIVLN
ncbi:MAG TPA: T9SS type A sorting domain-containing protein [Flavobacterium sp.]|nr:T9SS type A sorting domain-containing protein [Flavobacterium sp.]